jgi:hypothetical protein
VEVRSRGKGVKYDEDAGGEGCSSQVEPQSPRVTPCWIGKLWCIDVH